jgi:hypothetical protein
MALRKTIADQLNQIAGPGWKAVREPGTFGWRWTDGTRTIRAYSESVLTWDGYSDSEFNTVYLDDHNRRWGCNGVIFQAHH